MILLTGGVLTPKGLPPRGGGFFWGWGGMLPPRGPPPGGYFLPGGAWWRHPPKMATAVGSMHPTGMHSCFLKYQILDLLAVSLWYLTFYFLSRGLNNIEPTHLLK